MYIVTYHNLRLKFHLQSSPDPFNIQHVSVVSTFHVILDCNQNFMRQSYEYTSEIIEEKINDFNTVANGKTKDQNLPE